MDCEQLAPLYEEYALEVLEGDERAEIDAHLARGCTQCTAGIARARGVVAQLGLAAPDAQPPAALRGKILNAVKATAPPARANPSVEKATAKGPMFPAWAWAAAAALALITGYSIRQMEIDTMQLAQLRREVDLATQQTKALQNQIEQGRLVASVMMSPQSMPLKLMPMDKTMPMVHAYLHPHMGVAITADEMPAMPGKTLQLWFVPKQGKPMSVAMFNPDSHGEIAMVAPVNMPMNEIAELAITEEPAGGSSQPTTPIAWMAQVN